MTSGKFITLGTTSIAAASSHQLISGGRIDMPTPLLSKFNLASSAGLDISGSEIQGGVFNLGDASILSFLSSGNIFSDDSTITASSTSTSSGVVETSGSTSVTNGLTEVDADTYVTSTGAISTGDSGGQVQFKRKLYITNGGVLGGPSATTAAHGMAFLYHKREMDEWLTLHLVMLL
jgi:hypothetical protein